jgi:hypothetical protein
VDTRWPAGGGIGPPPDIDLVDVDEGPMRRELLRQIEQLELELTRLTAATSPWDPVVAHPARGPAVLPTADLELIRDELLRAIATIRERIVTRAGAEFAEEPPARGLASRIKSRFWRS